jgi:hypothetical protein
MAGDAENARARYVGAWLCPGGGGYLARSAPFVDGGSPSEPRTGFDVTLGKTHAPTP